jgi:hypothetical protein
VQRACRQTRAALVAQRLTLKERFRRQRPRLTTCPLVPVEERTPQPRRHEEYATCSRDATTSNEQSKKTTDRMHLDSCAAQRAEQTLACVAPTARGVPRHADGARCAMLRQHHLCPELEAPIFFHGQNVYLCQRSPITRIFLFLLFLCFFSAR